MDLPSHLYAAALRAASNFVTSSRMSASGFPAIRAALSAATSCAGHTIIMYFTCNLSNFEHPQFAQLRKHWTRVTPFSQIDTKPLGNGRLCNFAAVCTLGLFCRSLLELLLTPANISAGYVYKLT